MTFQEKQQAMLADLLKEREHFEASAIDCPWWLMRLEEKIANLKVAMGDENA